MAIAIEGFSVVALKDRIDENFDGGLDAFAKFIPNNTALADNHLWRCSFMVLPDAVHFLEQLQQAGFNTDEGPDPDLVLVNEFDLTVEPYCEWLQVAQWDRGVIAWREGTTPEQVVAREGWSPEQGSGMSYVKDGDLDEMEFLRTEDGIHVYFDKQRGREVYVGRTQPDPDVIFKTAAGVIREHGCFDEKDARLRAGSEEAIRQAIDDLERLAPQHPQSWRIPFFVGKGWQALSDFEQAYRAFRRAFELEHETESVLRELAGTCLELGNGQEAVIVAQKAAALSPDNPATLGNLACAYLISGRIAEAITTINAALKLQPDDTVNLRLLAVIQEVAKGGRPQPVRIGDLRQPATSKPDPAASQSASPVTQRSLWSRLQFWKNNR